MADLKFFLSTSHFCNLPPLKKGERGGFERLELFERLERLELIVITPR